MYGKGLALTLACTSPLFLQLVAPLPCTSTNSLQAAVHFARFLAGAQFRARIWGKCTSKGPPDARFGVHFRHFLAGIRALRLFSCTSSRLCKDLGEVHGIVQEYGRSAHQPGRRMQALSRIPPNLCKPAQGPNPFRVARPEG